MFKFLLGVLILASNFLAVSRAIAATGTCQQITTPQDLRNMGTTGKYCLANDIDASITATWNGGAGFVPLGTFNGMLDGQGHTIDQLTINSSAGSVGLFGDIGSQGVVRNLGLTNVAVRGSGAFGTAFGGLVGRNSGQILGSYTGGSVSAATFVGGLAGANSGNIANSYSTASTFISGGFFCRGLSRN